MAENTAIEWADHTFNPWTGCTKVSPACDHCFAEKWSKRAGEKVGKWGPGMPRVRTTPANWRQPLKWNAQAAAEDRRFRVFCASLADVFDNEVDPEWRFDLFDLIDATPHLDWLLLTKRIGNVVDMLPGRYFGRLPRNVWLGATICDQSEADRDIRKLLAVRAVKRFLSMEPLLGPVDLRSIPIKGHGHHEFDPIVTANVLQRAEQYPPLPQIDWVIVGGESGTGARPMRPEWARSLRDQCEEAGVPYLFKQWGEWGEPDSIERTGLAHQGWFEQDRADGGVPRHEWPGPLVQGVELAALRPEVFRVGKKAAGRLLDGRTWDEVPA